MKIAILGHSGAGKSTLAKHLSAYYEIPVLHLDTVQFVANWELRERDEAIAAVAAFMQQEQWVIEGNYALFLQQERLRQADRIIYLDFSRLACLYRVLKRHRQYRNTTRECRAAGCDEKTDLEFIRWILYKGRTKKRREHIQQALDLYSDKTVVIRNQRQLDAFIKELDGNGKN